MKVLVIGATGGFGGSMTRELLARGHSVTALVRPHGRRPTQENLCIVEGDALDAAGVRSASEGMDAIVFGFNVPYHRWADLAMPAMQIATAAAVEQRATLLFPGNVYGLGPDYQEPLEEGCARQAPTALGAIRNAMEQELRSASERGARVIVLRAGDYFGPGGVNSWFQHLTAKAVDGGALVDPAPAGIPHAWAFLPDVARAATDLLDRRGQLHAYEEIHFAGDTLTSADLFDAVRRALGDSHRKIKSFPWWGIKLAAPFWPMGRWLLAMRYLWREPLRLDGSKLARLLPDFRPTPLAEAVQTTLMLKTANEHSEQAA